MFFLRLAGLLLCLSLLQPGPASASEPCGPEAGSTCGNATPGVADLSSLDKSQDDRLQQLFSGSLESTVALSAAFIFMALGLANLGYLVTRKRVTGSLGSRRDMEKSAEA